MKQDVAHHLLATVGLVILADQPVTKLPSVSEHIQAPLVIEAFHAADEADEVLQEDRAVAVERLAGRTDTGVKRAAHVIDGRKLVAAEPQHEPDELAFACATDMRREEEVHGDELRHQTRGLARRRTKLRRKLLLEGALILKLVLVETLDELLRVLHGPHLLAGEQQRSVGEQALVAPAVDRGVHGPTVAVRELSHRSRTVAARRTTRQTSRAARAAATRPRSGRREPVGEHVEVGLL